MSGNYFIRNFLIQQILPLILPEPHLTGFAENSWIPDLLEPEPKSRPKFTILSGHVEEVLLRNKFFYQLSMHALVPKI